MPTPRNLHVVSPTILIPQVKKDLVYVYFAIRGTIKSHEKDSLIPIACFFDDDNCELRSSSPSPVRAREIMSNGQNVSSLSEFRFTTTLLVIPMDMDGLHWISPKLP